MEIVRGPINYSRQHEIFNPGVFKTPVHIIGGGATGSWLTLALAKLGVKDITVWDFDTVEEHNIPNQAFSPSQVGDPKVVALDTITQIWAGISITAKQRKVTGSTKLSGIVFVMTDTMASRKDIWEGALRNNKEVELVVEPRMSLTSGRVYAVSPSKDAEDILTEYEASMNYSDEEAEVSICGASQSVVATSMLIASLCTWRFLTYVNGGEVPNYTMVDCGGMHGIVPYKW